MKNLNMCCMFVFLSLIICTSCVEESKHQHVNGITDIDGNTYKAVKIGKQIWMTENLNVSTLQNEQSIKEIRNKDEWLKAGVNSQPAWCYFDNDSENNEKYGKLYNWHAINTDKLCPEGWRVPADDDWMILEENLGMRQNELKQIGERGGYQNIGGKLKERGYLHWISPNVRATNSKGFSALPGGGRDFAGDFYHSDYEGTFYYINYLGQWWSSTEYDNSAAWYRVLSHESGIIGRAYSLKQSGFSVRCIRNTDTE